MIKIYSGHGAEIHDLSTTSFRSASAIRPPPTTTPRVPANSPRRIPVIAFRLKHLIIRASSMPQKEKKRKIKLKKKKKKKKNKIFFNLC